VNWRDANLGINRSPEGFGAPWTGGAHFLMADGSARFVSENIDPKLLEAIATPDGGETVGEF
jgi:prepilin-type processing-associated H-X9-DG protein